MKKYLPCLITTMIGFSGIAFCSTPAKSEEPWPKNLSPDPRFYQYIYNGNLITEDRETGASFFNGKKAREQLVNCERDLQGWTTTYVNPYEDLHNLQYMYALALDEQKKRQDSLQQGKKETEGQAAAQEMSTTKK